MFDKIFNLLNLDSKDREIYLCLYGLGTQKASSLARELDQPKTNVLERLYKLQEAGLISRLEKGNTFYFQAENPEILGYKLRQKELEISNARAQMETILADLTIKKSKKNLPKVRYFEGKDGIIQIYEDTLSSKTEILAMGNFKAEMDYLKDYTEQYWQSRAKKGIKLTGLLPDDEINKKMSARTNQQHLRTSYFYPAKYSTPLEIDVYDDKVAFISFQEEFGALVESKIISQAIRNLLLLARGLK